MGQTEYEVGQYRISPEEGAVFAVAARRVPSGWRPIPGASLDEGLPFPWPPKYVDVFKQPFNPHGFFTNAAALANEYGRSGDPEIADMARALHARFLEYTAQRGTARFVIYTFAKSYRRIKIPPPWTSAYASGAGLIGLALLTDAGLVPREDGTADELLRGLGTPATSLREDDLWVSFVDDDGCLWFEEMPLPQVEQPRILNGHIRALTGLYIHWVRRQTPLALELLRAGILTIERHAMEFRRPGEINRYDLLEPPIADYGPDRTIDQQDFLWRMTGDATFARYRDVFRADIEAARRGAPVQDSL